MSSKCVSCFAALVLCAGAAVFTGSTASADSGPTGPKPASAQVNCSGPSCDGQDAIATGCYSGYTVPVAKVYAPNSNEVGELDYSPACRTVWAKISNATPSYDYPTQKIVVHRNSDGREMPCTVASGNSTCRTLMLYDGGVSSYAAMYPDTPTYCCGPINTASY